MDNPKTYDSFDWETIKFDKVKTMFEKIIEILPSDVENIIDIGCGNGVLTNELSKHVNIVGVDRSKNALDYVKTEKIHASAEDVPVEDNSFDLVFSSEMIEHLEEDIYIKAIKEFQRISRKYILITVPNRENLKKNLIQCPNCHFVYNRSSHLRTFSTKIFSKHFPEYNIIESHALGSPIRHYNAFLSSIKINLTPPESWIPYFIMPKDKRNTFCPKCEHKFSYNYKFNIISFICDMVNIIISPKRPYWQMVLLKKK